MQKKRSSIPSATPIYFTKNFNGIWHKEGGNAIFDGVYKIGKYAYKLLKRSRYVLILLA
jgi:hypothetical protein